MQYPTITTVLAALSTLATATASAFSAGSVAARDYSAATPFPVNSTLKWTGPSKGSNVTLYGTLPEIAAQLKVLDPDWQPTQNSTKSRVVSYESLTCCPVGDWNWQFGNYNDLVTDIDTVLKESGGGSFGVEPQSCIQIACAGDSKTGIWVCNDDGVVYLEIDVERIIDYAIDLNGCSSTCGQLFDGSGWNEITHGGCS